jgi:ribosomal protein S18 acetylase RimI-like enzyme
MTGITYKIEPATWRDLGALRHLEQVCFPQDAWPLWDLVGVLTLPNVVRFKAVVDNPDRGVMAGFIAGEMRRSDDAAWIATVGVLPEYRRQGIGHALIDIAERELFRAESELFRAERELFKSGGSLSTASVNPKVAIRLSVRISNREAIGLYERIGYQRINIWPGYYEGGEDALIMEKVQLEDENPSQEHAVR